MKKFTLSKRDIEFMTPIDACMQALSAGIQIYVANTIYPRLGIPVGTRTRYDLVAGELMILDEPKPEVKKVEPKKGTNGGTK